VTERLVMYSSGMCMYCHRARRLLESKGVPFDELRIDRDDALRDEMMNRSGRRTVPQIFIGETHVGGCDDLYALERAGKLDSMLNRPNDIE
jgi:glutaredoxin 3